MTVTALLTTSARRLWPFGVLGLYLPLSTAGNLVVAPPNTERAQRAWEAGIVLALLIFVPRIFVLMCGYSAVSQERAYPLSWRI